VELFGWLAAVQFAEIVDNVTCDTIIGKNQMIYCEA